MKTCFISAPFGFKARELLSSLKMRGIKGVLVSEISNFEEPISANVASIIKSCDITLCIAESPDDLKERLFELGIAFGIGKKVILVASYDAGEVPISSSEIPFIRLSSNNPDEIAEYVTEIIKYGKSTPIRKKYSFSPSKPIGEWSGKLLDRLDKINHKYHFRDDYRTFGKDVEKLVSDAIRESGVNVVSEFRSRYSRPDIAIWSDELTPYIANPLLVEVKGVLRNLNDLNKATNQLKKFIDETNSDVGLLIYLDGISESDIYRELPSYVLAITVKSLLKRLEYQSFGEVVIDLRNRRLHGVEG